MKYHDKRHIDLDKAYKILLDICTGLLEQYICRVKFLSLTNDAINIQTSFCTLLTCKMMSGDLSRHVVSVCLTKFKMRDLQDYESH